MEKNCRVNMIYHCLFVLNFADVNFIVCFLSFYLFSISFIFFFLFSIKFCETKFYRLLSFFLIFFFYFIHFFPL